MSLRLSMFRPLIPLLLCIGLLGCGDDSDANNQGGTTPGNMTSTSMSTSSSTSTSEEAKKLGARAPDTSQVAGKDWLIAIYMAADNDLDPAAASDLIEIQNAKIPEGVRVLVYVDRSDRYGKKPAGALGFSANTLVYEFTASGSKQLEDLGEKNSMDPGEISGFIKRAHGEPEEKKVFIFWDHGGSVNFGHDDSPKADALGIEALSKLFLKSPGADPNLVESWYTFDLLGFDACLMSSIEALTQFGSVAPLYVASAELEPGDGWFYTPLLESLSDKSMTPQGFGEQIVKTYGDFYKANPDKTTGLQLTLTMFRTDVSSLLDESAKFALALGMEQNAGQTNFATLYRNLNRAAGTSRSYGGNSANEAVDFIDMGDFLNQIAQSGGPVAEQAKALLAKIESLRVAYFNTMTRGARAGMSTSLKSTVNTLWTEAAGWAKVGQATTGGEAQGAFKQEDKEAPKATLTLGGVDDSGEVSLASLTYDASDDLGLENVQLYLGESLEGGELVLYSAQKFDARGTLMQQGSLQASLVALSITDGQMAADELSLAMVSSTEDSIYVSASFSQGEAASDLSNVVDGFIILDQDLIPKGAAIPTAGGAWATVSLADLTSIDSGTVVYPRVRSLDEATGEESVSLGRGVPSTAMQIMVEDLSQFDLVALLVAQDLAGRAQVSKVEILAPE